MTKAKARIAVAIDLLSQKQDWPRAEFSKLLADLSDTKAQSKHLMNELLKRGYTQTIVRVTDKARQRVMP